MYPPKVDRALLKYKGGGELHYHLGRWREGPEKDWFSLCWGQGEGVSSIKQTQNRNLNSATISLHQSPQESTDLPREWGGKTPEMEES